MTVLKVRQDMNLRLPTLRLDPETETIQPHTSQHRADVEQIVP